jgi:hypothetical protein
MITRRCWPRSPAQAQRLILVGQLTNLAVAQAMIRQRHPRNVRISLDVSPAATVMPKGRNFH